MTESSAVRVGIGLSPDLVRLERNRLTELVERINATPISHVAVTDHVSFRGGKGQDGIAALHYLAGLGVERELHTGVLQLPLRHPTTVARQLLDLAATHPHGVVAGVGLGGDDPAEYSMVGMAARDRGRRMDDALALLIDLLAAQQTVDRDGFYPAAGPGLERQGRRVRILVGGRVDAAHERAARADGWLAVFCSPERLTAGAARVLERSPAATLGYQAWVGVGADGRARADAQLERFYGLPPGPFERYVPVGDAATLAYHLRAYADAGVTQFNLFPAGEPELAVDEIAAVATEMT